MTNNPFFSYTYRDYENSRKEGMSRIPILSKGLWTDLNAGDPGVVLLDYMHALADLCNYYLDHQALESILSTSKERANLIRHAASVTYRVRSPKGATVDVKFYLNDSVEPPLPLTVPKGTILETSKGVEYLTMEDTVLTGLQVPFICPCEQGTVTTETYVGTGVSSRTPQSSEDMLSYDDQTYRLNGLGADADTVVIVDSSGEIWERVDFIAFEDTASKTYQLTVDPEHRVIVKFGDGVRGYSPKPSDTLTIHYINTMGPEGKITIQDLQGVISVLGSDGTSYSVNYRNDEPSSGGSYQETTEELRQNIMTSIKTNDRAVTREDFETLAATIDGVKQAKAYDIKTAPDICLYHEVRIVILPESSQTIENSALVSRVLTYLQDKSIPPTNILVSLPTPKYVPVTISITKQRFLPAGEENVYDRVVDTVDAYFDTVKIGEGFNPYELGTLIRAIPGVSNLNSISPSAQVDVLPTEIARKGTLMITME